MYDPMGGILLIITGFLKQVFFSIWNNFNLTIILYTNIIFQKTNQKPET